MVEFLKNRPEILKRKPLRSILRKRPTIILEKPLIELLGLDPPQAELPPGVTVEEAKEVLKRTWGRKLATGIADRAGMTGAERERFIETWADVVVTGILR